MFKKPLFFLMFAMTHLVARADASQYVVDDKNLRVSADFNHSVKAVAVAFDGALKEIGINPSSKGDRTIHIFGGDVSGPAVNPEFPNFTMASTMLRYAVYVEPWKGGSSAEVLLLMRSPSVLGGGDLYDVTTSNPDLVIELEKELLTRVAARLITATADEPK